MYQMTEYHLTCLLLSFHFNFRYVLFWMSPVPSVLLTPSIRIINKRPSVRMCLIGCKRRGRNKLNLEKHQLYDHYCETETEAEIKSNIYKQTNGQWRSVMNLAPEITLICGREKLPTVWYSNTDYRWNNRTAPLSVEENRTQTNKYRAVELHTKYG